MQKAPKKSKLKIFSINATPAPNPQFVVFKSLNHRTNYCNFFLSRDIESNPGPRIVDPNKTIAAPYSQSKTTVFGTKNAGTQCVAMSLSALIFNFKNEITSSADLVEVMNIGNSLYSTLSKSTKKALLLLTDLPAMVSLLESNYERRYSEIYSGLLNGDSFPIANFPCVTSLADAFSSLLRDKYSAFTLTVEIYTLAIYCIPNGRFKVFDSHSKYLLGMRHPPSTCTLIELDSLNDLHVVQYFYTFHLDATNTTYELKGVSINESQIDGLNSTAGCCSGQSTSTNKQMNLCPCKECCAISFYAVCFSTIKSCTYWNNDTVESIIENGKSFYQKYYFGKHTFISDLPNKLDINSGHIDIIHGPRCQGLLSINSATSKQSLKMFILNNTEKNTGFLLWMSSYCIGCVFQFGAKQKLRYNVFAYNMSKVVHLVDIFLNIDSLDDSEYMKIHIFELRKK